MKSEHIMPPSNHIDKEGFIEAERRFQEWLKTEEGQRCLKLAEEKKKGVKDGK